MMSTTSSVFECKVYQLSGGEQAHLAGGATCSERITIHKETACSEARIWCTEPCAFFEPLMSAYVMCLLHCMSHGT